MAINIPIVTDFDGRGIKRAEKAFGNLKSSTGKLASSMKSAFIPAVAALGGLAAVGVSAAKAAIEDAAAQKLLATQLKNTTKATDAQIAATEDFISKLSLAVGVADDELRPAFASLVRATKNTTKSQKLLKTALNVSKGTGKSLSAVVQGLSRAYGGNVKALVKLDPTLKGFITKTTTADQAVGRLDKSFAGMAAASANTLEGKMARLGVAFNEMKEQVGVALMPVVEKFAAFLTNTLAPYVQEVVNKFSESGLSGVLKKVGTDLLNFIQNAKGMQGALVDTTLAVGAFFSAFKAGTLIVNFVAAVGAAKTAVLALGGVFTVFAATPLGLIITALALAAAGVVVLINALRDPIFRKQFGTSILDGLKLIANVFIAVHNLIANTLNSVTSLFNKVLPKSLQIGKLPTVDYFQFSQPEQNNSMLTPRQFESGAGGVTINVNGGDPQATVDAITRWYRQNGATVAWMR